MSEHESKQTSTGESSSESTHIETCGPMDILAGRTGKRKQNILGEKHPGTRIFNETIARNLQLYQDRTHRRRRSYLIKKVVSELLSKGCRFVKYDGKVEKFLVLDQKQIRDKVSFAFRHRSIKQVSPLPKKTKREAPGLFLRETGDCVMNDKVPVSPCSVTSTLSSLRDIELPFLRPSESPQPGSLLDCDAHIKDDTTKGSSDMIPLDDEDDDDQEFIGMIEELDIDDGLTLMFHERVCNPFDIRKQSEL